MPVSSSDSTYDPFQRHDRYGTAGATPQPLSERLLLAGLSIVVVPVKVVGALTCLVSFYGFCRASALIPARHRGDAVAAAGRVACRACLFCLGFVRVRWERAEQPRQPGRAPAVIVSNHCSWVDILVHMSRSFPAFVARDSTKHLVLIGLISEKMGCLFVDREKKESSSGGHGRNSSINQGVGNIVKERISRAARGDAQGMRPMLLFPEGTTTNGRYLLPFKSGAFLAGCPVQPVILKYAEGRVSPAWESIPALQHVWLILCIPFHRVTAVELPVYTPSKEEAADPLLFARNVRSFMLKHGSLKPSESTLADKRELHNLLRGVSPAVVKKSE